MKKLRISFVVALVLATANAVACGYSSPTSTSTPTSPAPSPTPTTQVTATPSAVTMGQMAQAGQAVYASRCAKCHGQQGQGITGPAVIGPGNNLSKYGTAQGLLSFIDVAMPLDSPGSLTNDQYDQVLCYLLVQNNFAAASTPFNAGQLSGIALK